MPKSINSTDRGFSLIEALVAISILVVALIAIIGLFPFLIRLNKQAEQLSTASALGRTKLEQYLVTPYDQLSVGTIEPRAHVIASTDDPLYIFERQTVINYLNSDLSVSQTDAGLKQIKTTVYWPNKQGNDNGLILTSLKAKK